MYPKHPRNQNGQFKSISLNPFVSQVVFAELRVPVLWSRHRTRGSLAAGVTMPKASMNEYHLAPRGEDEVGGSRQVAAVQAKAIAERVGQAANAHFRFRVLAANACHERAASRINQWFANFHSPA